MNKNIEKSNEVINKAFNPDDNEFDGWMSLEEIITKKLLPHMEKQIKEREDEGKDEREGI